MSRSEEKPFYQDDDINLSLLFNSIKRKKILISLIISISGVCSLIYSSLSKPVWKGGFDIVIKSDNQDRSSTAFLNSPINSFLLDATTSDNQTQKLILTSESVLMPVFDYVKKYLSDKGNNVENLYFQSWVDSFDIEYEKNTKVLSVEYTNQDRELILSTLKMISEKYKDYSKREVTKDTQRTIDYLENQKKVMEEKAAISRNNFNNFAIKQGLGNIDGFLSTSFEYQSNNENSELRKSLQNKSKINKTGLENFNNLYSKSQSAGQRYVKQFLLLEEIEAEYSLLSTQLKPNSKTLSTLKDKIEKLKTQLKRPNEILIKYNDLSEKAMRDSLFLSQIKSNLELAKLEQVKIPKAWETISTPKIYPEKVSPKRIKILILTIFTSSVIGIGIVLIKEKFSGIIYAKEQIIDKLECSFLETISPSNMNFANLLIDNLARDSEKEFFLVNYKNKVDSKLLNEITKNNMKLKEINLQEKIDLNSELLLLIESEVFNYKDIEEINKYIKIYKDSFLGWIFIEK